MQMMFFLLPFLMCTSLTTAARIQAHQRASVSSQPSFKPDSLVKNERYVELREERAKAYQKKNLHSQSQPSRLQGEYYWQKAANGTAIERCCCPMNEETKQKMPGERCKYFHALSDSAPAHMHLAGLKKSIDPRKWGEWVCPGKVSQTLGWHHPEDDAKDAAECDAVKSEGQADEEAWQEAEDAMNDEVSEIEGNLRELVTSWGCKIEGGTEISGTHCGTGGLTNVHNCEGKSRCITTACYRCEKSGVLFSKRKGEGMVEDETTGQQYLSTTQAVRASALEQCRAACSEAESKVVRGGRAEWE